MLFTIEYLLPAAGYSLWRRHLEDGALQDLLPLSNIVLLLKFRIGTV